MITLDLRQPRPVHRRAHVLVRRAPAAAARRPPLRQGDPARRRKRAADRRRGAGRHRRGAGRAVRPRGARDVHGRPDRAARPEHRRGDRSSRPRDRGNRDVSTRTGSSGTSAQEIGAPDDDVALLLIATDGERTAFEAEVPAEPSSLPALRRRLRAWLAQRAWDDATAADVVLAVSEACNNAIEHAYDGREGTIRLTVSEVDRGDPCGDRGSGTVARDRGERRARARAHADEAPDGHGGDRDRARAARASRWCGASAANRARHANSRAGSW